MKRKTAALLIFATVGAFWLSPRTPGGLYAAEKKTPVVVNKIESAKSQNSKLILKKDLSVGVAEGPDEYMLNEPTDIAADAAGNIFVLDGGRIRKYNPQGQFLMSFSQKGEGPGEILGAEKIQIDAQNNVIVFDWEAQRVSKFSNDGKFIDSLRTLFSPKNGVVDSRGDIFLYYLHGDFLLHKLAPDGKSKTSFIPAHPSKEAAYRFHVNALGCIAITPGDKIYLLVPYPNTIYICNTSGEILKKIVNEAFFASPPHIAADGTRINHYRPLGLHITPNGYILARHYRFEIPSPISEKAVKDLFNSMYSDYSFTALYDPSGKFLSLTPTPGFAENGDMDRKGFLYMITETGDGFRATRFAASVR